MTDFELRLLVGTAATLGLVHTVIGPDHYIPFIAIGRARGWGLGRTLGVAFLAGLGHVASSVLLGFAGIALGIAVESLTEAEEVRGGIASWLLIGFGLAYGAWGVARAFRNRPHTHVHVHDGTVPHEHPHGHDEEHVHVHDRPGKRSITPWVLFAIFVFGPCEPLIPLVMFPAAKHSLAGVCWVTLAFGATTIFTMLAIIGAVSMGLMRVKIAFAERWSHAMAGGIILASGLCVRFLGL